MLVGVEIRALPAMRRAGDMDGMHRDVDVVEYFGGSRLERGGERVSMIDRDLAAADGKQQVNHVVGNNRLLWRRVIIPKHLQKLRRRLTDSRANIQLSDNLLRVQAVFEDQLLHRKLLLHLPNSF